MNFIRYFKLLKSFYLRNPIAQSVGTVEYTDWISAEG